MSQLGAGLGSSYPTEIDTRQTFQNVPAAAPDSDTRFDAEALNDTLTAILAIETTLGAGVQGSFASLAARLDALLPDSPEATNVVTYFSVTDLTIAGATHGLGTDRILNANYDLATPHAAFAPQLVTIDPVSYDVTLSMLAPQSGLAVLAAPLPIYAHTFTGATTLTIPGATHGLGMADLSWQLDDGADPRAIIEGGGFTVDPTTFEVTVFFAAPQSGRLLLSSGGPRHVTTFTAAEAVTILGTTHGLETVGLLWHLYDASTPRAALFPGSLTVHPTTFDVVITFAAPQSGRVILTSAIPASLMARRAVDRVMRMGKPPALVEGRLTVQRTLETLLARVERLEAAYATLSPAGPLPPEGA